MAKFLIFYTFHRLDPLSINRLRQIMALNPGAAVVPCFGAGMRLPRSRLPRRIALEVLMRLLQSPGIESAISERSRRKLGDRAKRVRSALRGLGLEPYFDFTPLGYYNQDKAIRNWFRAEGRGLDFDYLVYLEYDVYLTRSVSEIYSPYLKYDAAFVNFREIDSSVSYWKWIKAPVGVKKGFEKWLRNRGCRTRLYLCFFPGLIISRPAVEAISSVRWPSGFCELRLPTIVSAMGFSCGRLDFPYVRFEGVPRSVIKENPSHGIFHSVRYDLPLEEVLGGEPTSQAWKSHLVQCRLQRE
ncbi:MAG: hypothetical protein ACO0C9_03615 [Candidatus Methanosuratincola verstraetei]